MNVLIGDMTLNKAKGRMFKHGDWKNNRDEPDALSELVAFLNNKGLTEDDDDFLKTEAILVGGVKSK